MRLSRNKLLKCLKKEVTKTKQLEQSFKIIHLKLYRRIGQISAVTFLFSFLGFQVLQWSYKLSLIGWVIPSVAAATTVSTTSLMTYVIVKNIRDSKEALREIPQEEIPENPDFLPSSTTGDDMVDHKAPIILPSKDSGEVRSVVSKPVLPSSSLRPIILLRLKTGDEIEGFLILETSTSWIIEVSKEQVDISKTLVRSYEFL